MTTTIEKVKKIEEVARLHLQGKSDNAIATALNLAPNTVKTYIAEWEDWIADKATQDPDILDRHLENTLKFDQAFAQLESEAWEVVAEAKEAGVAGHRIQALKLASEMTQQRAKLHQLLGPKLERGYMQELKKAERINQELSRIIREVISQCPYNCKPKVWDKLEELFTGEPDDEEDSSVVEPGPVAIQLVGAS